MGVLSAQEFSSTCFKLQAVTGKGTSMEKDPYQHLLSVAETVMNFTGISRDPSVLAEIRKTAPKRARHLWEKYEIQLLKTIEDMGPRAWARLVSGAPSPAEARKTGAASYLDVNPRDILLSEDRTGREIQVRLACYIVVATIANIIRERAPRGNATLTEERVGV